MTDDLEHPFMCLFAIHISSLVMCLLKYLAYFILLGCWSSYYGVVKVLYTFWIQFFCLIYILHIFLLVCGVSLHCLFFFYIEFEDFYLFIYLFNVFIGV